MDPKETVLLNIKIQKALNYFTQSDLKIDGVYGDRTRKAMQELQRFKGLKQTGYYTDDVAEELGMMLDIKFLNESEIERGAILIGCDPDLLRAIMIKESMTGGFIFPGRVKILFERHIFYHRVMTLLASNGKADQEKKLFTMYSDIFNKRSGGYSNKAGEHDRLNRAKNLCIMADIPVAVALESTSWGLGQVLGINAVQAGFKNVVDMVMSMELSENYQFRAMVNFINNSHILKTAFQKRDFNEITRHYNGDRSKDSQYKRELEDIYSNIKK